MKENYKQRKNIGVLGGTRFIGHHLLWALHNRGHKIHIFNRGITKLPGSIPPNIKLTYGDRNHPSDLKHFFKNKFDAVIDLSGYSLHHVEPIVKKYRQYIKHYIFCSTTSVYSLPLPLQFRESKSRTKVPNTYGRNKAKIEDFLFKIHRRTKWPITILRPHGVFGKYDTSLLSYVFYRLHNSVPTLFQNKNNKKINFLYVKDLVNAFLLAMNNSKSYGKVYNVAGDDITSQKEYIEMCGKIAKKNPIFYNFDNNKYNKHNKTDIGLRWQKYNLVADNRRIKQDLKLSFIPLKNAIEETFEWIEKNPKQNKAKLLLEERYILKNYPIPEWVIIYRKISNYSKIKLNLLILYFKLIFVFMLFNKLKNLINRG
jgi:nucleoside-diphosphate-sugar epimerase